MLILSDVKKEWNDQHEQAFQKIKAAIAEQTLLAYISRWRRNIFHPHICIELCNRRNTPTIKSECPEEGTSRWKIYIQSRTLFAWTHSNGKELFNHGEGIFGYHHLCWEMESLSPPNFHSDTPIGYSKDWKASNKEVGSKQHLTILRFNMRQESRWRMLIPCLEIQYFRMTFESDSSKPATGRARESVSNLSGQQHGDPCWRRSSKASSVHRIPSSRTGWSHEWVAASCKSTRTPTGK